MSALVQAAADRFLSAAALATARRRVSDVWRFLFARAGVYVPISDADRAIVLVKKLTFAGDTPVQVKGGVGEQGRMAFRAERPDSERVENLVVTPLGAGWSEARLQERYSAGAPGLRMLLAPRWPAATYPSGYWVQSAHQDTYGDWVSEYLGPLARRPALDAPLFLPARLASRPYVRRDLAALGLDYVAVVKPVRIEAARVLRQQKYFVHFDRRDVDTLRSIFKPVDAEPRPGGLIYLSRAGEVSEVARRDYPNAAIEELVRARGGRILRTAAASFEDYRRAAVDAETVIFDHGSAFYNALAWRPRQVIEIVSDRWWNNAFLMLADAMGVPRYVIVRGDLGKRHVVTMINEALDHSART